MANEISATVDEQRVLNLVSNIARGHDCVIIIPPFASVVRPALGPHILQALSGRAGMSVAILYSNLILAHIVGVKDYERVCDKTNRSSLIGERIFARVAHGLPRLGLKPGSALSSFDLAAPSQNPFLMSSEEITDSPSTSLLAIEKIEKEADRFCSLGALGLLASACRVFGATSSFEQTNAAIAILRSIKRQQPTVVTLMGGLTAKVKWRPQYLN